ncbi:replication protein A 70 kDa DNA-binding subunit B [Tanacetum coccineum]
MFRFEPLLQDGICYLISNFEVTENGGRFPILPHDWKLAFYKNTNMTRIDQFDDNFTGFKSEPFKQILDSNEEYEENNYGLVRLWLLILLVQKKIRRTVVIEDEEGERIDLTFWDSWDKKWNEYAKNLDNIDHIDVMLVLGKVKYWNDVPAVHNALFGTKLYINRQLSELLTFRQSIQYESGWTYIDCKVCSKKVEPVAAKGPSTSRTKLTWWCTKHEIQEQVVSRFHCLGAGQKYGPNTSIYFPEELNGIIGKRFLFKVKFSEFNHNNNSHVYRCKRVTNDEEIINFWRQGFVGDQDSEEDSEEDVEENNEEDIEDGCVHASGSEKKCQRTIERSIVVIDLSDLEFDTKDDENEPNAKKPMMAVDQDAIAQKAIVTIKKEKDVKQNVEKDEEPK